MKNTRFLLWLLVIIVLAGAGFGYFFLQKQQTTKDSPMSAVFLNSDQVYFGHITKNSPNEIVLENVYYLKANASLVDTTKTDDKSKAQAQLSLVKLGDELHKSKDRMVINKTNVLFWEEMQDHGVIIDAIHADEKKKS